MTLTQKQKELCSESQWDFSDLSALFLNCTLKPGSQLSHTEGLMNVSKAIMEENGVQTEILRPAVASIIPIPNTDETFARAGIRLQQETAANSCNSIGPYNRY